MFRLWREIWWRRRLEKARWDVSYFRSAVDFYNYELKRAEAVVDAIESAHVDVVYPKPRGVTGSAQC